MTYGFQGADMWSNPLLFSQWFLKESSQLKDMASQLYNSKRISPTAASQIMQHVIKTGLGESVTNAPKGAAAQLSDLYIENLVQELSAQQAYQSIVAQIQVYKPDSPTIVANSVANYVKDFLTTQKHMTLKFDFKAELKDHFSKPHPIKNGGDNDLSPRTNPIIASPQQQLSGNKRDKPEPEEDSTN